MHLAKSDLLTLVYFNMKVICKLEAFIWKNEVFSKNKTTKNTSF